MSQQKETTIEQLENYVERYLKNIYDVDTISEVGKIAYRNLYGEREAYLVAERQNMSAGKRKDVFPEYEKGALLWSEKETGERRKNENSEFDIRREKQGITEEYFGTEKGRAGRGRVSEVSRVSSTLDEEISIIDEALKDESLSQADRLALIKDKVRLKREAQEARSRAELSAKRREELFPDYDEGALLWNENVDKSKTVLQEKNTRSVETKENQKISAEGSGGVQEKEPSDLQQDIEEEISIIDEALKDESLSQADRLALIKDKVRLKREANRGSESAGTGETSRSKKLYDAVEAYKNTGDTSGIPTRQSATASKKYYGAKIEEIEKTIGIIDEAMSDKENISDMEYDELKNWRDALNTQWREAAKKNSVLSEVLDILDEIDTAARPNHNWVKNISASLSDKKNLLKYGTYNLNDIERNFKIFFGEHFKTAYEKVIQPLYDSKKAYAEGVTEYTQRLKKDIVDGLGIKKGSRMSAAVQWLGEGMKPVNKKAGAELAPYTYRDCVAEFGEAKARDIKKATEIFREMYDELLDKVNEARAMLYPNNPDKLIPKRADYFRHFQEMGEGFSGLRNILQTNIGIDPMLVGVSENTKPKSKWQSFAQARGGNRTEYDAIGGFLDYLPAAMYSTHIDPNIVNVRSLAYDLASAKANENNGSGNSNANGFIAYLQRYANHLAGKTVSHFDRAIQDSNFGRTALSIVSWLNNKTKASAVLGNINSVLSQVTNIKNAIGKIGHQEDILRGAVDALAGLNADGKIAKRYEDSGFLKERYLDRAFSQFDTKWQKINPVKWAADILGYADEIGTRITWNAGYNEAIRKGVENPVQYADNFTRACVAGRGIGEEALVFKSQIAKMFLPFRTEVLNDLRMQQDILFGEEYDIWEKNTDNSIDDEKNYVDLSFDNELVSRVKGMRGAGKYKVIRDFILEKLGDKDIVFSDGLIAKVDRSDAAHIASSAATKKTTYISKLDELIKKAELYATANEVEHNKFDEFKYYRVVVKLEGKTYPVYLNVGRAKNGDGYHLYDITKKIGESQSTAFERVDNDLRSKIDSPIGYSISQSDKKSNKNVSTQSDTFDEIVAMGNDGAKKLTYEEEGAILSYKGGGSYALNSRLRRGVVLSNEEREMVRLINEALDKLPVHRGVVYRNIGFYAKDEFEAFVESLSTGAVEGKAFTSASKIKGAYDVEMPYNAHYEIESITGRDIEQYGEQSEKEVLFKRCTLFEVVNVRVLENTAYVVLKESASNEITDTGYGFDDSQNFNGNSRQAGYEGRSEELSVRASAVRGGSSAYDKVFQKQSRSNGGAGYGGSRRYNAGSDQKAGNDSYTEGYDVSDWLSAQYIHDGKSKTGVGKRVKNIMQLCIALIKSPLLA